MHLAKNHGRIMLFSAALGLCTAAIPLAAQDTAASTGNPATASARSECSPEIGGGKPKIYIANFFVTYGKKTMGRLIADNIAFRFENDERFELIPRKTVDKEMSPLFKKKLAAEDYLSQAVSLAATHQADCVIFGKIGKKGSQISFLVRMASVATGENKVKVDQDVDRKDASTFFEKTGDSLTAYFNAAPAAPIAVTPLPAKIPKAIITAWGGYDFLLLSSTNQTLYDAYKAVPNSTTALGGISGGLDVWIPIREGIDIGGGVGYLAISNYKVSGTIGSDTVDLESTVSYLPIMGQIRFISGIGIFAGLGAGYYTSIADQTYTINGIKASASTSGSAFGISANVGWQISLGSRAALNLGGKFWHIFDSDAPEIFTPYAGISVKF
jgi:hypothetical protein